MAFATFPSAAEGGDAWTETQEKGGWWIAATDTRPAAPPPAPASTPPPGSIVSAASVDGDAQQYPFFFLPYPSSQFRDGSSAHLPWLQEMPDTLTSAMWSSWVEINPPPPSASHRRARRGRDHLEPGIRARARGDFPGIAPDMVAMRWDKGHSTFTRYAAGRGDNPTSIIAPMKESATGSLAWAAKKHARIAGSAIPHGRLVLFAAACGKKGQKDGKSFAICDCDL